MPIDFLADTVSTHETSEELAVYRCFYLWQ